MGVAVMIFSEGWSEGSVYVVVLGGGGGGGRAY